MKEAQIIGKLLPTHPDILAICWNIGKVQYPRNIPSRWWN